MRTTLALIFSLLSFVPSFQAQAFGKDDSDAPPPQIKVAPTSAGLPSALATMLTASPATPRGPNDLLRDYEAQMEAVSRRFSNELGAISQAVQNGQLSREQAEETTGERYQVAMMQFQLLSALHAMLEREIDRDEAAQHGMKASQPGDTVMVAVPFSSLQLNPSLIQYLQLTETQAAAIEELMENERRNLEPIMAEIKTDGHRLLWLNRDHVEDKDSEEEVHAVAASQAAALSKLIVANSHMHARIYQLLNGEQRRKLDELERTDDLWTRKQD
jgi:Spy/CpxP family protein refolding chaperone